MNIDTLLRDTFTAHEDLAPDAEDVFAAVQQRVAHQHGGLKRPLAVAAGVAVIVAVVGGAAALSRHAEKQPAFKAAASETATPPPRESPARIAPLTMPYDLGWLPPGSVTYVARRINIGAVSRTSPPLFDGEYMLIVTTASGDIDVDVQQFPGDLSGSGFKSGPGTPITIGGRDGIESTNAGGPGGYEVYFQDADGGLMYVNVAAHHGDTVPADQLSTIGRRVADNVRFPGTSTVEPSFGIGYVPAGATVRAFDVDKLPADAPMADGTSGSITSYDLGTTTTQASVAYVSTVGNAMPSGTPGRDVQGHATRYRDDSGYRSVYVLDAVDGQHVMISGSQPLSELYKIADGLILPK